MKLLAHLFIVPLVKFEGLFFYWIIDVKTVAVCVFEYSTCRYKKIYSQIEELYLLTISLKFLVQLSNYIFNFFLVFSCFRLCLVVVVVAFKVETVFF
jgi:hypothetical protein